MFCCHTLSPATVQVWHIYIYNPFIHSSVWVWECSFFVNLHESKASRGLWKLGRHFPRGGAERLVERMQKRQFSMQPSFKEQIVWSSGEGHFVVEWVGGCLGCACRQSHVHAYTFLLEES